MEEEAHVEEGDVGDGKDGGNDGRMGGRAFTADPWRICSAHDMHTAASFFFLSCVAEKCERDWVVWHCGQQRVEGRAVSRRGEAGVTAEESETMEGGMTAPKDEEEGSASREAAVRARAENSGYHGREEPRGLDGGGI